MVSNLLDGTRGVVDAYTSLPTLSISTPYYNNRSHGQRAAFRALIGKGTPEEISEEFSLMLLKERKVLENMSFEDRTKYAVTHNLGIDCSGFVFHVMNTLCHETHRKGLRAYISFPRSWNIVRRLIARFRVAENTSVYVLSHDANSIPVSVQDARPGDVVTFLATKREERSRDHIVLIDSVTKHENGTTSLTFVHAIRHPEDGLYNHGIKRGEITVTNPNGLIQEQVWREASYDTCPTLSQRKDLSISLRRLKAFVS